MSLSSTLDVAIGLMFVYYLLGSVVSLITQLANELLETRGNKLQELLKEVLGSQTFGDVEKLPQIEALRPIRYKNLWSFATADTAYKKVEKIPVSMLVDAVFDVSKLTQAKIAEAGSLIAALQNLPPSKNKDVLIGWFEQGLNSVESLRARASDYYNGVLEQAAAKFRASARSTVIMLSILVTLLFGTDSIQLASALWSSAELRAIVVDQAPALMEQSDGEMTVEEIADQLAKFSIRIGWWQTQSWPAADANAGAWVWFVVLKVLGLSITVFAVSQGSSFWYDLLKKVINPAKSLGAVSSSSGSGDSKG